VNNWIAACNEALVSEEALDDLVCNVKGISFVMKSVQGGAFLMGSEEKGAGSSEQPAHNITLYSYYIGETEVTQELWIAVMGKNTSRFKGKTLPVDQVSWYDAIEFCNKLSTMTGRTPYYIIDKNSEDPNNMNTFDMDRKWKVDCVPESNGFRLPTEAEWEFAAKGGNKSVGYQFSGSNELDEVAWCTDNSGQRTHQVKTKKPNELGIYDMSGNMMEWCYDWCGEYSADSQINPTGHSQGDNRVRRGGDWATGGYWMRLTSRDCYLPEGNGNRNGFRIALTK